jgi:hypothetical protein
MIYINAYGNQLWKSFLLLLKPASGAKITELNPSRGESMAGAGGSKETGECLVVRGSLRQQALQPPAGDR